MRELDKDFMPAYDVNRSDGRVKLNLMKAVNLPAFRQSFRELQDINIQLFGEVEARMKEIRKELNRK